MEVHRHSEAGSKGQNHGRQSKRDEQIQKGRQEIQKDPARLKKKNITNNRFQVTEARKRRHEAHGNFNSLERNNASEAVYVDRWGDGRGSSGEAEGSGRIRKERSLSGLKETDNRGRDRDTNRPLPLTDARF